MDFRKQLGLALKAVAMAYVPADKADLGTLAEVEVRGRRIEAKIVELPFYKRS